MRSPFILSIFVLFVINSCDSKNITELRRSRILSVYLTWDKPDTSNHIVINYISIRMPKLANVYFDSEKRNSIIENYSKSLKGKTRHLKNTSFYVTKFILNQLNFKKDYYFVVGDQVNGFSREFKFRTLPNDDSPIEFIQGGDLKYSKDVVTVAKKAMTKNTMALLIGGDLAYANGKLNNQNNWEKWFHNLNEMTLSPSGYLLPLIVAIGNHETKLISFSFETKAPFYFLFFEQNNKKTYFYRRLGQNSILFILDSGHVYSHDGKQSQWLEKKLVKFKNINNKFAMYHVPLYPSARNYNYGLSVLGRKYWLPIFDKHNLTLSFENHDHLMKRTKLLKGNKVSLNNFGTIYIGDGCWGMKPRKVKKEWYLEKSIPSIHVWRVNLDPLNSSFKAINLSGEIIDQFVISNSSKSLLMTN